MTPDVLDADHELTGVTDPDATLTFTYDSGGNQLTAATSSTAGQPDVTLTSGYDGDHHRTSLADDLSSAGLTTYQYDPAFLLTTITTSYGGTDGPQVVLGYDPANRLTSESRTIGGSGTAVATSFSYDNADRLATITHQVTGGAALATYVYGYDDANRLTSEQNAEGTVTYSYDSGGELTGASGSRSESYSYDSGGNRTMTGYTTGSDNELTASPGETYTYDAEGNLTGKTDTGTGDVWTYTWDYRNRLTGVLEQASGGATLFQATYTYDALNRRIGTELNGTQTWMVWDGLNPYAKFSGAGALQDRYLFGPAVDEVFARTDSGGTTAWYLTDHEGSVRDIVDASGTVLDHIAYGSFGTVLSESNAGNGDQFKFDGMQYDSDTGLYFDNARYYDPSGGRFVSQDPLGFAAGDANLFRFVTNGPTNSVDLTGYQEGDGGNPGGGGGRPGGGGLSPTDQAGIDARTKAAVEAGIKNREALQRMMQNARRSTRRTKTELKKLSDQEKIDLMNYTLRVARDKGSYELAIIREGRAAQARQRAANLRLQQQFQQQQQQQLWQQRPGPGPR